MNFIKKQQFFIFNEILPVCTNVTQDLNVLIGSGVRSNKLLNYSLKST
jgi:hypothetical protein